MKALLTVSKIRQLITQIASDKPRYSLDPNIWRREPPLTLHARPNIRYLPPQIPAKYGSLMLSDSIDAIPPRAVDLSEPYVKLHFVYNLTNFHQCKTESSAPLVDESHFL